MHPVRIDVKVFESLAKIITVTVMGAYSCFHIAFEVGFSTLFFCFFLFFVLSCFPFFLKWACLYLNIYQLQRIDSYECVSAAEKHSDASVHAIQTLGFYLIHALPRSERTRK